MIRERDESLNTLLKLFQTEREFVLISFSDGVQRRYRKMQEFTILHKEEAHNEPDKASKRL